MTITYAGEKKKKDSLLSSGQALSQLVLFYLHFLLLALLAEIADGKASVYDVGDPG